MSTQQIDGWEKTAGAELARRAAQLEVSLPLNARERVWAGLERRRARLALHLALPMFLAGAATAALILLLFSGPHTEPALLLLPDGTQESVRGGDRLPVAPALTLLDLHGAGRVVAGPSTRARLDRFDPGGVALSLERGSLLLHVNPRTGDPLLVRTPGFVARVVGTVLRVAVSSDGRASIAVGHGAVEVTPTGGQPRLVRAGERWPADAVDAPSEAELDRLGPADLEGTSAASFTQPKHTTAPVPAPDTTSESALYRAAWQRLKARDLRGALALWQEQRARYPHGVLSLEAHASVIDALVALHDDARARAEVDAYLRRAPGGLRAPEMHFVRGTLYYAADHDCHRAAADFDRALQRPSEPWAQKARAARAACRKR